jgi:phosphohistidine phosphatase SixA
MKGLEEFYRLKDGFQKPTLYVGAEIIEWQFQDQPIKTYWSLSSGSYVKEAIKIIEKHLSEQDRVLCKSHQPMLSNYRPELDITPHLNTEGVTFYQSQISVLRWMVELGRLDIIPQ